MGEERSLLSYAAYTFGILNAVIVVKSRLRLWLGTGDSLIKLLVDTDRSHSAAATPASDHKGQGRLSCLDSEICGELILFTYRKSIIHCFCWLSFLLS